MSLRNHNEVQIVRIPPNMTTSLTVYPGYIRIANEKDIFVLKNWNKIYHTDRIRIIAKSKED